MIFLDFQRLNSKVDCQYPWPDSSLLCQTFLDMLQKMSPNYPKLYYGAKINNAACGTSN